VGEERRRSPPPGRMSGPGRRLRFGIKVTQMDGAYPEMREAWLEADRLGFDTAWAHDHLLNLEPSRPENEGWTLLTALLVQSPRIRGGLMVTANTFRHPALLAKIATTVDLVSGGRLEVGLGAGWFEEEHRQYGLPLPPLGERMQRLDEACRILKALWTQPRATFEGVHYQLREAFHEPKPVQRPHPPLVIGTSGERVGLRIIARHAQEWNMAKGTPEEFGRLSARLDGYCREAGRDPAEVERSIQFLPPAMSGDAAELAARARAFVGAGATHLIFSCPLPYSAAGARWLWEEVVPRVRGKPL
jgi:F420-dependent oxidoreductase-like protein